MSHLQILFRALVAVVVLVLLGFGMGSFQVSSNEAVVLTRFGAPVCTLTSPGIYGKWPWPIDTVNRFDTRIAFYDTRLSETLTQDKRNVIVPLYLAWHTADPLKFLQALGPLRPPRQNWIASPPAHATPCSVATTLPNW